MPHHSAEYLYDNSFSVFDIERKRTEEIGCKSVDCHPTSGELCGWQLLDCYKLMKEKQKQK